MDPHSRSIQFIGKFLRWYQDSYSLSDVVNRIKLEELVKEAEDIHTQRVKEIYRDLDTKYHEEVVSELTDKPTRKLKKQLTKLNRKKRISRYL